MTTSDLVARLTARANLTYSYPIEDILLLRGAANEIERLREALDKIAALDVPRPVMTRYRADGEPSKYDRCTHLIPMWDDCARCISSYANAARAEKEEK